MSIRRHVRWRCTRGSPSAGRAGGSGEEAVRALVVSIARQEALLAALGREAEGPAVKGAASPQVRRLVASLRREHARLAAAAARVAALQQGTGIAAEAAAVPGLPAAPLPRPPRGARARPGRRVLVVEDERAEAESVAAVLARHGHVVELAGDGAAGLERARARHFDLILLDVMLPAGADGFSVAERLRGDRRTRDVPILFLSARGEPEARLRGLGLGASDYIEKPFHPEELLARAERAIAAAELRDRLEAEALRDELTGLDNFRAMKTRLRAEEARARRYGTPLAVVVLDVDRFKQWNDERGHAAGNALLAQLGRLLAAEARETDATARFGGDEFVVVLPQTGAAEATRFAERVRARFRVLVKEAGPRAPTLSIGVAGTAGGPLREDLLEAADAALYRAKRRGGDVVEVAPPAA